MEFRVLGPLEVLDQGELVPLGTLKERIVLATLLLHANEIVSRSRLIDELWGESPPPTAKKAVNVYVSQLRKALTRDGRNLIVTVAGGYRLELDAGRLDVAHMQQLLAQGRDRAAAGELAEAAELLREALALWRGPTLSDVPFESFARVEADQLEELRLSALMDRIDCDLALGRHEQVLAEVNLLVREHPLRERLRAQQMLALYRADRQVEALDAYAEARRTLVDDLGIEPSEALQRLQQAILRHDPSLETPEGTATLNGLPLTAPPPSSATDTNASDPPVQRSRFGTRRRMLAIGAIVLLAASITGAAALSTSSARATPHVVPNSLVRLDPRSGKPTLVVRVGVDPNRIAITPSAIWTANYGDNTVSRYDLRTHAVESRSGFPGQPFDIVVDQYGNGWITSSYEDNAPAQNAFVTQFGAGTGGTSSGTVYPSHVNTRDLPLPMAGYEALGGRYLWVIVGGHGPLMGDDRLALVDLLDDEVVSVKSLHHSATAIAVGYGSAWVGTYGPNLQVETIRAGDSKARSIQLGKHADWGPLSVAVGYGAVWALTDDELVKIDPQTLRILHRLRHLSLDWPGLAMGAGAIWVEGHHPEQRVTEIDPRTDRIIRTIPLGGKGKVLCGIAATRTDVWVAVGNDSCDTIGR